MEDKIEDTCIVSQRSWFSKVAAGERPLLKHVERSLSLGGSGSSTFRLALSITPSHTPWDHEEMSWVS